MARDLKADLAKLETLRGELRRIQDEAIEILTGGDPRAAMVLGQLDDTRKELDGYLPYARDLAIGTEERREMVHDWMHSRYGVPKRGAA